MRVRIPECQHAERGPCPHSGCRYHEPRCAGRCVLVHVALAGPLTGRQVAARLGVSHQRVAQLEARALRKLAALSPDARAELLSALRHLDGRQVAVEPAEGEALDLSDRDAWRPWVKR